MQHSCVTSVRVLKAEKGGGAQESKQKKRRLVKERKSRGWPNCSLQFCRSMFFENRKGEKGWSKLFSHCVCQGAMFFDCQSSGLDEVGGFSPRCEKRNGSEIKRGEAYVTVAFVGTEYVGLC